MKVLLDENLPPALRAERVGHAVFTARYIGWNGLKNGELIARAAASRFEALVTMDADIPHQQNIGKLPLAIVILTAPLNDIDNLRPLVPELIRTLDSIAPRTVVDVR